MQLELYKELLNKAELSNTKSRKQIFLLLAQTKKPYTLPDLADNLSSTMDRTTVYRTVDSFVKANIVKRIYSGWKQTVELSDQFNHHHHHMTCIICGKVIPFEESYKLSAELEKLEEAYRFTIDEHTIELRGRCTSCRSTTSVYA